MATGFRNPDGLGLAPDGTLTVPNSEGEWTPASMICEIRPGGHYGYNGPKDGRVPDLPLVYLPRGLDNSSGGQVTVPDVRFGPLAGQLLHFSFGAGTHFLVLREKVDGQPQGAAVPLPGEFRSGVHRGRFNPKDGQLYVTGMTGWGSYTPADGCFRASALHRRAGPASDCVPRPRERHPAGGFHFLSKRSIAEHADRYFAQAWNYRYGASYGSPELSTRHPGQPGHDALAIRSAHVLAGGRIALPRDPRPPARQSASPSSVGPDQASRSISSQPCTSWRRRSQAFLDISPLPRRSPPIRSSRTWRRSRIRPCPIAGATGSGAPHVTIEVDKNLSYKVRSFEVKAGEPIELTLINPDAVPHNWALVKPGALASVGDLVNKIIAEPDAASRHYIPRTDDVIVYTDVVGPQDQFSIRFRAPRTPGRYPYLCTFPGHWMVMNGEMIVK